MFSLYEREKYTLRCLIIEFSCHELQAIEISSHIENEAQSTKREPRPRCSVGTLEEDNLKI